MNWTCAWIPWCMLEIKKTVLHARRFSDSFFMMIMLHSELQQGIHQRKRHKRYICLHQFDSVHHPLRLHLPGILLRMLHRRYIHQILRKPFQ